MVNMTLAIPEELQKMMKRHKDVRWSEVARQAIRERAAKLDLMDKILAKSRLTEEDAERIGHKIKRGIAKRYGLIK